MVYLPVSGRVMQSRTAETVAGVSEEAKILLRNMRSLGNNDIAVFIETRGYPARRPRK